MKNLFAVVPALLLSACVIIPLPVPKAAAGECRNDGLQRFVGQPATQQLGAEMLRVSGATRLQWINPGMAVTMDFRPERLRIQLGANGRIESLRCG